MRVDVGITGLLFALLLAGTLPAAERSPEPPKRRYRVAAIGDSLTDQRAGGGRYLAELAKRCPKSRFDAYGVGGQRTLHMRWRFDQDVLQLHKPALKRVAYSHVLVLGGVNDLSAGSFRSPSIAATQKSLNWMYRRAHQHGLEVVAITVPPWGKLAGGYDKRAEATRALNAWIAGRAAVGEVDHVVDVHPLLSCGDPDMLCPSYRRFADDLVHWNQKGHERVAQALHTSVFSDCE